MTARAFVYSEGAFYGHKVRQLSAVQGTLTSLVADYARQEEIVLRNPYAPAEKVLRDEIAGKRPKKVDTTLSPEKAVENGVPLSKIEGAIAKKWTLWRNMLKHGCNRLLSAWRDDVQCARDDKSKTGSGLVTCVRPGEESSAGSAGIKSASSADVSYLHMGSDGACAAASELDGAGGGRGTASNQQSRVSCCKGSAPVCDPNGAPVDEKGKMSKCLVHLGMIGTEDELDEKIPTSNFPRSGDVLEATQFVGGPAAPAASGVAPAAAAPPPPPGEGQQQHTAQGVAFVEEPHPLQPLPRLVEERQLPAIKKLKAISDKIGAYLRLIKISPVVPTDLAVDRFRAQRVTADEMLAADYNASAEADPTELARRPASVIAVEAAQKKDPKTPEPVPLESGCVQVTGRDYRAMGREELTAERLKLAHFLDDYVFAVEKVEGKSQTFLSNAFLKVFATMPKSRPYVCGKFQDGAFAWAVENPELAQVKEDVLLQKPVPDGGKGNVVAAGGVGENQEEVVRRRRAAAAKKAASAATPPPLEFWPKLGENFEKQAKFYAARTLWVSDTVGRPPRDIRGNALEKLQAGNDENAKHEEKRQFFLDDEVADEYNPDKDDLMCREGEPLSCVRELRRFFDYFDPKAKVVPQPVEERVGLEKEREARLMLAKARGGVAETQLVNGALAMK
mmetsp:Transcript_4374/g.10703  ORF Transcript_4374/g.10703 Transcript_4374/m.10703 type:complete len:676 (-) Transcript_4374:287-2314(-)|eukprot:CAMPEP_0178984022 /NCGR_PEP_ID=MMETSP0795-20121207/1377_1 /TAXON_ID=88552 /ORGANISM="Amoebophrya sp., Strain Ameob2" /LENGTH=675 /DNA_ID=CAMNT_0020674845 /DNA_START=49 /DNA_END=2076 /DNA_ORIENTATION=+